jgi:hypothetical protein
VAEKATELYRSCPVAPCHATDLLEEWDMATNIKDGKSAKSSKGSHGGNRRGDQGKKEDVKKSSQAAGKDPHRGSK